MARVVYPSDVAGERGRGGGLYEEYDGQRGEREVED